MELKCAICGAEIPKRSKTVLRHMGYTFGDAAGKTYVFCPKHFPEAKIAFLIKKLSEAFKNVK